MNTTAIVAIIVAVIALAVALWAVFQTQRSKRLRTKFGREYDYTVDREGDRRKAEAELTHREESVKHLRIRELTQAERDQFAAAWRDEQARFVDDPAQAVASADALISRVMTARGFPTAGYETQVAYASVDHSRVINDYREAHQIAERSRAGHASTEELRRAMIGYRALFESLVGSPVLSHRV
jgi:FtsZ-interacting cell division protein ZipA